MLTLQQFRLVRQAPPECCRSLYAVLAPAGVTVGMTPGRNRKAVAVRTKNNNKSYE